MTSKERVLKAIQHQKTDRVPIDLGSTLVTGIHAYAYNILKKHLKVKSSTIKIIDTYQFLAQVEKEILERLHIDVIPLVWAYDPLGIRNGVGFKKWVMPNGEICLVSKDFNPEKQKDGSYTIDQVGGLFRMPKDGFYFDAVRPVFQRVKTYDEIEKIFSFSNFSEKEEAYFKDQAIKLQNTEKAVIGEILADFEIEFYFGYEQGMMNWILNKKLMNTFLERLTEKYIRDFEIFHRVVGDKVDIIIVHRDLGAQNGPVMSPDLVREVYFPNIKRLVRYIKEHSNYFVMLHSCGSIYEFIPDIIDCGFDILNPVQISAKNMEPERLKREFREYLCFWGGGVDTQYTLPFGTPEDVKGEVHRNIEIFGREGGFVFNTVHNIQAGVPIENLLAMFEAFQEYST